MKSDVAAREEVSRRLINNAYRRLLRTVNVWADSEQIQEIRRAFQFAVLAHQGVRRRSGEPYVLHPVEVALITSREIGLHSYRAIIAALLHDVVEDTDHSIEDIEGVFGKEVAHIIEGLTKVSHIVSQFGRNNSRIQVETLRHLFITLSTDPRIMIVKLADRLHNLRTLEVVPRPVQLRTASETFEFYAPVARRMGIYEIATEMEDLALKYTDPIMYHKIDRYVQMSKQQRKRYLSRFLQPIEEILKKEGFKFRIKTRTKSIYSIYRKIREKRVALEQIYDVLAVRIILDVPPQQEKDACFRTYSIITRLYRPNPQRFRDWINHPKSNGYQALHTTVMGQDGKWVEVQIRSSRMDEIATRGAAAHWKYKEQIEKYNEALDRWIRELSEILSTKGSISEELLSEIQYGLFFDDIQVFTPRGDLVTLSTGATVLDFAFAIHTELGQQAVGAKVNGRVVPLDHPLQNGDQVQIIRTRKNNAKEEWLHFVRTPQARAGIRRALRKARRTSIREGKNKFYALMEQEGVILEESQLHEFIREFNAPTELEFFHRLGRGEITADELRRALRQLDQSDRLPVLKSHSTTPSSSDLPPRKIVIGNDVPYPIRLAGCCMPVPGDEVAGILTSRNVIKIHQTNCPYLIRYSTRYGKQLIEAEWDPHYHNGQDSFLASIRIEGVDAVGLVYRVTQVISGFYKVNIRSLSIRSYGGHFEGEFVLEIASSKVLHNIIDRLEQIEGIEQVYRMPSIPETVLKPLPQHQ